MTRKEEIEKGLKYFRKNKERLSSLYKEMYGEEICFTCPGKNIEYAFEKIYAGRNEVFPSIRMKRSKVINTYMWDDSLGFPKDHFTFHNTSDEMAKRFIEIGYSDYFVL